MREKLLLFTKTQILPLLGELPNPKLGSGRRLGRFNFHHKDMSELSSGLLGFPLRVYISLQTAFTPPGSIHIQDSLPHNQRAPLTSRSR